MWFLPLTTIIESHSENVILLARGTSYKQFPISSEELKEAINRTKTIKEGTFENVYHPFVKADFNIEKIGHSFANDFGLFLMQTIHNSISFSDVKLTHEGNHGILDFEKAKFLYFSNISKKNLSDEQEESIERLLELTVDADIKPKIIYIDDQAELGWNKLFAGMIFNDPIDENFITIPIKDIHSPDKIISNISRSHPNIVLLDLRLKGNLEDKLQIEEISGYKILILIKNKFPSLPVIITSATNKSESLSALLKAGAEGLWTKPRVENLRNSQQLYDCYFNFIDIAYKVLTKFKTELDKKIFELDFHRHTFINNQINQKLAVNSLFIFDTNYFICNDTKFNDFYNRLNCFISLYNCIASLGLGNRIIIISDVISELNLKSIGVGLDVRTSPSDIFIQLSAKYSHDLILDYLKSESNVLMCNFGLEQQLRDTKVTYSIETNGNKFILNKHFKVLVDKYSSNYDAEQEKLKLEGLHLQTILHADDTFKLMVYNRLRSDNNQNLYFISNDHECKYKVYRYIENLDKKIQIIDQQTIPGKNNKIINAAFSLKKKKLFLWESSRFIGRIGL